MKNIIKQFGFIALVAIIGFTMAACGGSSSGSSSSEGSESSEVAASGGSGLDGTYIDESGRQAWTFSGNKLSTGPANGPAEAEYTYEIKDGKIHLTRNGQTGTLSFEIDGNKIKSQGITFIKQ